MKIPERTLRIGAASTLALVAIGGAYVFSGPTFFSGKTADAASTEELLKEYAAKDTDNDGLPDWQEALYGTNPSKADSDGDGISDGEAMRSGKLTPSGLAAQLPSADQGTTTLSDADFDGVPAPAAGSITEQFSHEFLQEYMSASNGQPMDEATQQALVQNLMTQFTSKATASFASTYSAVAVHTSNSASTATYASQVEDVLRDNDVPAEDSQPLDLMQALLVNDDPSARKKLLAVSAAYASMAAQMKSLTVPAAFVDDHVQLVQSMEYLSRTTSTVADFEKDPLATLGAFGAFENGASGFSKAISSMATKIVASGEPGENDPGFLLVSIARLSSS